MAILGAMICSDWSWLLLSTIPVVYNGMCGMTQKYSDVLVNGNVFVSYSL